MNLLQQMEEAASRFGNCNETSTLGNLIQLWINEYEREVGEASRRWDNSLDEIDQLRDELDEVQTQAGALAFDNDKLQAENEKLKSEIAKANNRLEGFITRTVGCVRVL